MIQRLQSIFLLFASLCLGGTFLFPYADSSVAVPGTLFADSFFTNGDNLGLSILAGISGIAAFGAIFLYQNRPLQKNVCRISLIITIITIVFGVVYFMQEAPLLTDVEVDGEPGSALPLAALVFVFLAIRYIDKDEKLVRSADRLR